MAFLRQRLGRAARSSALVLMAGASLAACATTGGTPPAAYPTRTPHAQQDRHRRDEGRRETPPPDSSGLRGTMKPYQVNGVWYRPHEDPDYDETGLASWYGAQFHNRSTADGELFDMDAPSGAHKTLPLPCIVEVTNLENGRRLQVRINDRGPFVTGRILDLSREAARQLGFYEKGTARVRVRYVGPATSGLSSASSRASRTPPTADRGIESPADGGLAAGFAPRRTGAVVASAALPPVSGADLGTPRTFTTTVSHWTPPAEAGPLIAEVAPGRVQAGAFADRGNAERAAARLADAGEASVEPMDRAGQTLWKVTVRARGGDSAEVLRDRVEAAGFPGARIVN